MDSATCPATKIKWGIIAPGRIASKFASDLLLSDGSDIVAVASRNRQRADEFATTYSIPEVYDDYDALLQKSDCDIVYIASPHVFHKAQALACIRAGKAVLCEKPVTLSARDFAEIELAAAEHQVFFMEAMWTRFFPVMEQVLAAIAEGTIGKVTLVQANFGFKAQEDFTDRLYAPELGGGSLLDTGVYVLTLAQMVYQCLPQDIMTQAVMTPTGVDGSGSYLLRYGDEQLAMLSSSIVAKTVNSATIYGETGFITINNFWMPDKAMLTFHDGHEQIIDNKNIGAGYYYEIKDIERCLANGLKENPKRTLNNTRDVLMVMDGIRQTWGLVYPGEH